MNLLRVTCSPQATSWAALFYAMHSRYNTGRQIKQHSTLNKRKDVATCNMTRIRKKNTIFVPLQHLKIAKM